MGTKTPKKDQGVSTRQYMQRKNKQVHLLKRENEEEKSFCATLVWRQEKIVNSYLNLKMIQPVVSEYMFQINAGLVNIQIRDYFTNASSRVRHTYGDHKHFGSDHNKLGSEGFVTGHNGTTPEDSIGTAYILTRVPQKHHITRKSEILMQHFTS